MRTHYEISSEETGTVIIRCRKISKALRRWLRERDVEFNHRFFLAWWCRTVYVCPVYDNGPPAGIRDQCIDISSYGANDCSTALREVFVEEPDEEEKPMIAFAICWDNSCFGLKCVPGVMPVRSRAFCPGSFLCAPAWELPRSFRIIPCIFQNNIMEISMRYHNNIKMIL